MMRRAFTLIELIVLPVMYLVFSFGIGAFAWTYSINTWLGWFGKNPSVVWWQGGLIGVVPGIGQLCIPAAPITWIVSLFM